MMGIKTLISQMAEIITEGKMMSNLQTIIIKIQLQSTNHSKEVLKMDINKIAINMINKIKC